MKEDIGQIYVGNVPRVLSSPGGILHESTKRRRCLVVEYFQ